MRQTLFVILTTASLGALGCGGSSSKSDGAPTSHADDSAAGGAGGSQPTGVGGSQVAGAGGSTTGQSCPSTFTPCGGDVTGTWHLKFDECLFTSLSSALRCPGETFSVESSSTAVAQYTFTTDGSISISLTGSLVATFRYPPGCLGSDAGAAQACSDVNRVLQAAGDAGVKDAGTTTYNCFTEANNICACNETVTYGARSGTGSYIISGTKLTLANLTGVSLGSGTADAGTDGPLDYCVSGNALTIAAVSSSGNKTLEVWTR
jgi:hypothetical protein